MSKQIEYECPYCGGRVEFDSATQKLKCPFCDSSFEIDELSHLEEVSELVSLSFNDVTRSAEETVKNNKYELLESKQGLYLRCGA